MIEPNWLSRAEVETLHAKAIELSGGSQGLRDANLLESALARPKNLYAYGEVDNFQLAAIYAEGISRNHAFVDGNKRTAFMAADVFLFKNGQEVLPREDDGYVELMESLAQGHASRAQLADYLKANARASQKQDEAQGEQVSTDRHQPGVTDWSAKYKLTDAQRAVADQPTQRPDGPKIKR